MRAVVISWNGQHKRALSIYRVLSPVMPDCRIVWSDPGGDIPFPEDVRHLRRPDDRFWGDKFHAAIASDTPTDILFIHADCQCNKWPELVEKCRNAFAENKRIAVWSPLMLGTPYPLARTVIEDAAPAGLKRVAQTDGQVFALRRDIVERMLKLDYSKNGFGWGIDWMFMSAAEAGGHIAVVDPSVVVRHKVGRGYAQAQAAAQMKRFLAQMTPEETRAYRRLSNHVLKAGGPVI